MDEEGFLRLSQDDGGAGIAACLPAGTRVEIEIGLEFFGLGRVALVAMLDEEGADVSFEILEARCFVCMQKETVREEGERDFDCFGEIEHVERQDGLDEV